MPIKALPEPVVLILIAASQGPRTCAQLRDEANTLAAPRVAWRSDPLTATVRRLVALDLVRHYDNHTVDGHNRRRYVITDSGRAHLRRELAAIRRYLGAAEQLLPTA